MITFLRAAPAALLVAVALVPLGGGVASAHSGGLEPSPALPRIVPGRRLLGHDLRTGTPVLRPGCGAPGTEGSQPCSSPWPSQEETTVHAMQYSITLPLRGPCTSPRRGDGPAPRPAAARRPLLDPRNRGTRLRPEPSDHRRRPGRCSRNRHPDECRSRCQNYVHRSPGEPSSTNRQVGVGLTGVSARNGRARRPAMIVSSDARAPRPCPVPEPVTISHLSQPLSQQHLPVLQR
jgi:hypothetical protein